MFAYIYSSPVGSIVLAEKDNALTHVLFGSAIPLGYVCRETPFLQLAWQQLQDYFAGQRQQFDLPLDPAGTPYQQKVWTALQTIPYGQTASYLEIAIRAGNAKACRAVGMANHNNPIAIIIPCHRVIGKNGKLVGYGGGLDIKEFLLNLEQQ